MMNYVTRCENKGATCDFRLAQEGVLSTVPFIGPSRLFTAYNVKYCFIWPFLQTFASYPGRFRIAAFLR